MIPFEELSAALDRFAGQPVSPVPAAAPVAVAQESNTAETELPPPPHEESPVVHMAVADTGSQEIELGDIDEGEEH